MSDLILRGQSGNQLILRAAGALAAVPRRLAGGGRAKGKGLAGALMGKGVVIGLEQRPEAYVPSGDPMMRAILTGYLPPVHTPSYISKIQREVRTVADVPAVPEMWKPPTLPPVTEVPLETRVRAEAVKLQRLKNLKKARRAKAKKSK